MSATTRRVSDLLFGPETPARLLTIQTGLVVLMGLRIALSPFRELTPQPPGLFRPVAILGFLDRMPSLEVIVALQVIGTGAAITWLVLAIPRRSGVDLKRARRITFVLAWVCLLVLAGLRGSRGKIYHNDLLMIWAALPFIFGPFDVRFGDRTPTRRTGWPVCTSIAIVALIYFMTGFWKLRNTGIEWVFGDNMRWILYHAADDAPWPGLCTFIANRPWLSVVSAGFILAFEVLFVLVVFWRRSRPVFVIAAWIFHVGTYLMLGLDYWLWAGVVTLLLIDWPPVLDRMAARLVPSRRARPVPARSGTGGAPA